MEKKKYIVPESSDIALDLEAVLLADSDIQSFDLFDDTTEDQI